MPGWITDDEYSRYYQEFRSRTDDIDNRLVNLQKAEDDYYLTANYLLQLSKQAYELFVSSEMEQKRQLLKLLLQNPTLEGKKVRYSLIKPFDTIPDYADHQRWLRRWDSSWMVIRDKMS